MNKTTTQTTIQTATSRGQVTLPAQWRKLFNTNSYLFDWDKTMLRIKPIDITELKNEEIIFDADRDNNDKDIDADELLAVLKSIDG